jgi:hypothetical protein
VLIGHDMNAGPNRSNIEKGSNERIPTSAIRPGYSSDFAI